LGARIKAVCRTAVFAHPGQADDDFLMLALLAASFLLQGALIVVSSQEAYAAPMRTFDRATACRGVTRSGLVSGADGNKVSLKRFPAQAVLTAIVIGRWGALQVRYLTLPVISAVAASQGA
jgi:hypothetical protein